jgi:hypothetical protein
MSPRTADEQLLRLRVTIDSDGTRFRAVIAVSGRKRGIRQLEAGGPTCDELADALLVSMLLLLDEDPGRQGPSAWSSAAPPEPARTEEPSASVWLSVGGALTHGLPEGISGALAADVLVRSANWQAGAGVLWAPERRIPFAPGSVDVQAMGGHVGLCFAPLGTEALRVNACALAMLLSLSGSGHDFDEPATVQRPWFLVGGGPELDWAVSPSVALGLSGSLLVTLHDESFSVENRGRAYDTDRIVAWFGAHVAIRIW